MARKVVAPCPVLQHHKRTSKNKVFDLISKHNKNRNSIACIVSRSASMFTLDNNLVWKLTSSILIRGTKLFVVHFCSLRFI